MLTEQNEVIPDGKGRLLELLEKKLDAQIWGKSSSS